VAELSGGRERARLWRLALDLPLAEAVAAVAQLDRRWRPADEPGRDLLARLAAERPRQLRAVIAPPSSVRLSLRWLGPGIGVEFAPDGRAVALHHQGTGFGLAPPVIYYELPGGRRKRGFRAFGSTVTLFAGGMVFAALGSYPVSPWFRYLPGHGSDRLGQVRQAAGNRAAAVRGGFLIAEPARLLYGTAEPGSPVRDVTPPALRLDGDRDAFRDIVTDPLTGRLAVHVVRRSTVLRDDMLILDPDFSVVGQLTIPFDERWRAVSALGFCSPGRLITVHGVYSHKQLRSWAVGPPAVAEAETELRGPYPIQTLPYTGLIKTGGSYLDATTLRPAPCPSALTWGPGPSAPSMLSRDGGYAAIWQYSPAPEGKKPRRKLLVRDLVQQELSEWAARPMAGFSADDRAAVTILTERLRGRPPERAAALLRDCLAYRAAR
jgi:hypothetical protein